MPRADGQNPTYLCVRCGCPHQCPPKRKALPCPDCKGVLTRDEKLLWGFAPHGNSRLKELVAG